MVLGLFGTSRRKMQVTGNMDNKNHADTGEFETIKRRVRIILIFFLFGFIASGLTAFPIRWEVAYFNRLIGANTFMEHLYPPMAQWISHVHNGLMNISDKQMFIFYLTDWLGFAYILIGVAFLGPLRNPVRNIWVIEWAIVLFLVAIPLIFVSGSIRAIPFFWRLIDCSFGLVGILLLWVCRNYIKQMEKAKK